MTLSSRELKSILATVEGIALEIGAELAKAFRTKISATEKSSPHDLVTKYDKEGEEYIYKKLASLYPEFGFLGEEGGYRNFKEYNPYWIVDPVDGTLNFARGIPAFSVSIALVHYTETLLGVCYNPISKEMYTACKGMNAFLNGSQIHASTVKKLDHSVIAIPADQIHNHKPKAAVRRTGSSVLDICYVAKGATEAFYDSLLNPWDFAASSLIAKEAGAKVISLKSKSLDTNKKSDILVANEQIVDEFSKWILMAES